ncbi:unnamed protein product [Owenia fusiformis]|uniref:Uncharacterized protein n=1 Tax=Owenia fusiformis TaxID=6347 RepID=A0A8J1XZ34_OWEFU|nr:unnamed protein product [Owenia fusiformis]
MGLDQTLVNLLRLRAPVFDIYKVFYTNYDPNSVHRNCNTKCSHTCSVYRTKREELMYHAVNTNHLELVKDILEHHSYKVNEVESAMSWNSLYPLHLACYYGNKDMIELLLKNGADVNIEARIAWQNVDHIKTAFGYIFRHDDIELMCMLLPHYRNKPVHSRLISPIHYACKEGAFKCLKYLTANFPNQVNERDVLGNTPLMFAVWRNKPYVEVLLKHGAGVHTRRSSDHKTCLHICLSAENPHFLSPDAFEIATLLLDANASVNAVDAYNYTPLTLLCAQIQEGLEPSVFPYPLSTHHMIIKNCMELLIDNGAHVNYFNDGPLPLSVIMDTIQGCVIGLVHAFKPPLQTANEEVQFDITKEDPQCYHSNLKFSLQIMEYLLSKGANPNVKNTCQPLLTQVITMVRIIPEGLFEEMWRKCHISFKQMTLLLLHYGAYMFDLKEAFKTRRDISDIIELMLNSLEHERYNESLRAVCNDESIFNGDPRTHNSSLLKIVETKYTNPRSLKQIARVNITQNLRTVNHSIESSANQLPLPQMIIDYVLQFENV